MWNEVFREHQEQSPQCDGELTVDMDNERQRGLCWQEQLKCSKCKYVSSRYNLYDEVRTGSRGPKTAAPNLGLQVGLCHSPMAVNGFRKLCASAGLPAPNPSSMARHMDIVRPHIIEANEDDMKQRCEGLKKINRLRGEQEHLIPVEADGAYNNNLYSGTGHTPFQTATQAVYTVAENTTSGKQVISLATTNKLCNMGSRYNLPCPNHPGCTANLAMEDTIGNEKAMAKECLGKLAGHGLHASDITTDADSGAADAGAELKKEGVYSRKPRQLLDTRHLSESQRKKVKNIPFSDKAFPGKLKADREWAKGRFSVDISKRCQAEFEAAFNKHAAVMRKVKRALSYTRLAIPKCYQGDHSDCKRYSLACAGGKRKTWIRDSNYLPEEFVMNCNAQDEDYLQQVVDYRLDRHVLDKTALNTNTQKVEGVNRSHRRSNPKNVTFSKNFEARAHCAVHSVNNGDGESIAKLCDKVGAGIKPNTRVARQLRSMQRAEKQQKEYKKSPKAKKSRTDSARKKYKLHETVRKEPKLKSETYAKGMRNPKLKLDHSYTKYDSDEEL